MKRPLVDETPADQLPVTERGKRSRQALLDAAEKVFGEIGYYEASVTDIVRAAGVAQGTFYLYFSSKKEIFVSVLESLNQVFRTRTKRESVHGRDFAESELLGLNELVNLVLEHCYLFRLVRQSEMVDPELHKRYFSRFGEGYVRRLTVAMKRAEIADVHPEAAAYCLMGIADFVCMRWPYWSGRRPPKAAMKTVSEFITRGLGVLPPERRAPRRIGK
jgi:AcrR family transcriptional regulator